MTCCGCYLQSKLFLRWVCVFFLYSSVEVIVDASVQPASAQEQNTRCLVQAGGCPVSAAAPCSRGWLVPILCLAAVELSRVPCATPTPSSRCQNPGGPGVALVSWQEPSGRWSRSSQRASPPRQHPRAEVTEGPGAPRGAGTGLR